MRASQYSRSFSVWAATLRALLAAPVLGEEGLERGPDVLLALDEDGLEVVRVEAAEDVQHRALVVARAERFDLAVAEEVAHLGQLLGRSERSRIVRVEVVAVRAVEGVDVPQRRVVARLDDLERLHVARRDERPARLALVEELLLGHLVRLGVVRDEDDLHVAVLGADELEEEEEEAARQVLLHGVHGARGVHDAHHDGVRLPLHVGHHVAVDQIVLVEGEAVRGGRQHGLGRRLEGVGVAARELPLHPLEDGAALVEADAEADRTVALALGEPVGLDLAEGLALQVRELQVLEHNVDQLLQRDVGLVVVAAGLVPGLVLALAGLLGLADHLAGLRLAVPLADARGVLAVDELVLADAADGDLDDLLAVLHDRVVLLRLLLVPRARLGDDAADVAHRRHELLLDRFLERLIGAVGDALAAAARRPEVGDHLLTEPFGRRADDRDLLLDRLQKPLVGLQLLLGVAFLHPRLVVERLHDEACRDAAHALALGVLAQLLDVDLLGLALLDDLLAVVELELGDQVALRVGLEAREDGEHGGDLERVWGDVRPEIREANDLLVDLDLLGQTEVVGDLHDDDAVEDRLVGVVGLELLPLGLVGVGEDHGVDVDQAVPARRRDHLLLRGGDHGVQVLGLVLEDLDELAHAAVADVDGAVQVEHARVALRVHVELRDVLAADEHRGVLVVRVDGRDDADADAVALREEARVDRHLLVPAAVLLLQAEAAHRAEVALDVHAEHLLELLPQMARNEVEGLLGHGAVLDRVEGLGGLEAPLEALDQRALPRADRAHPVEDLAALLAPDAGGGEGV